MKILYVENHAVFAQIACQQFLAQHDVQVVPTVHQAVALLDSQFDVLLVDYDLDDGKGDVVVTAARARRSRMTIIGVSSHAEGNASLVAAGADVAVLKKNFSSITELLETFTTSVVAESSVVGSLVGAMVGDALGCPFEGSVPGPHLSERIRRRENASEVLGYSDDTDMMLGVAESLLSCMGVDPEHLLATFAKNYEPARGYGHGMKLVVRAVQSGVDWREVAFTSWKDGSRGNGAAVRVAPVACGYLNAAARREAARMSARTTHAHEEAIAGALVQAELVAHLLCQSVHRLDVTALQQALLAVTGPLTDQMNKAFDLAQHDADAATAVQQLGHGTLAAQSVPIATYAFLTSRESFTDAVRSALELGGDTDSIAALVGAMAGALHGLEGIPRAWLKRLERGPRGIELALKLGKQLHGASSQLILVGRSLAGGGLTNR